MKYCERPFKHTHIRKDGKVACCSWSNYNMGDLTEDSLKDIWFSDKAQKLRDSFKDGSFKYCCSTSCHFISNDSLPDITLEEYERKEDQFENKLPVSFNLAYDFVCNHACPTCRDDIFKPTDEYKEKVEKIQSELLEHLHNADVIMATGNGDVFSSQNMIEMLSKISPKKEEFKLELETNGVLAKKNWKYIQHLFNYNIEVVVTPNSYERETYKKLSGGLDNLDKTLESIEFLSKLRDQRKIKKLKITMVVQDENFREIPDFVEYNLSNFNVDLIQLRPLMVWFDIPKEYYLQKNILNPKHPSHNEFINIINSTICKHPKVYHWCGNNLTREEISLDSKK